MTTRSSPTADSGPPSRQVGEGGNPGNLQGLPARHAGQRMRIRSIRTCWHLSKRDRVAWGDGLLSLKTSLAGNVDAGWSECAAVRSGRAVKGTAYPKGQRSCLSATSPRDFDGFSRVAEPQRAISRPLKFDPVEKFLSTRSCAKRGRGCCDSFGLDPRGVRSLAPTLP